MKRFVALALAAALCLAALTGCSGPSSSPASAATAPQNTPAPVSTDAPASSEPAAAVSAAATPAPTPEPAPAGVLPEEDYAYFQRVGFGAERDGALIEAKWISPLLVEVRGQPTAQDSKLLSAFFSELKSVAGMPEVRFVTEGGNVRLGFVAKKDGKQINDAYNGTDDAQLFTGKKGDAISSASIVIAAELTDQSRRDAALASLLLRALGLAPDAQGQYSDSALNQNGAAAYPSVLDWLMLALLYRPEVTPGMTAEEAMPVLRGLDPAAPTAEKTANANSFTKAELLDYFNEVGFYYKDESSASGTVSKWASPIRLQITGSPAGEQKQLLDEYIARLNRIKGFPGVTVVASDGNLTLSFLPRERVKKSFPGIAAAEACALKVTRARGGTITGCSIGVDAGFKDAAQSRSHLLRALLWALGLNFTSETWQGSILSLQSNAQDWANLDWKMLELLYRQDVKAGAGRAAVMEELEKAVK